MPSSPAQDNVAYHILPAERRILRIEIPRTSDALSEWQRLVGGYVEFVPARGLGRNSLLVNEEGLFGPGPLAYWRWEGFSQVLAGPGLLLGGKGGVSCALTHEQVLAKVTWL